MLASFLYFILIGYKSGADTVMQRLAESLRACHLIAGLLFSNLLCVGHATFPASHVNTCAPVCSIVYWMINSLMRTCPLAVVYEGHYFAVSGIILFKNVTEASCKSLRGYVFHTPSH